MYRSASQANLPPSVAISLQQQLFCLCRCSHETDAERALTGTWVMDEVRLAVEKRYKVLEIFEVYE